MCGKAHTENSIQMGQVVVLPHLMLNAIVLCCLLENPILSNLRLLLSYQSYIPHNMSSPLPAPPTDVSQHNPSILTRSIRLTPHPPQPAEIEQIERSLTLPRFTSDDAYTLGTSIRASLRTHFPAKPAVVQIVLANSKQLLFHACSLPGTLPDNDSWVARKTKTVLRWGKSSWQMHNQFGGDEARFAGVFQLGATMGEYAIHGGAVPIRVQGVEGAVAVCIVSGLKQQDDHQIVIEGLKELKESMG